MERKWANLRDSFATQRRTYEARLASGSAASPEPKWPCGQAFEMTLVREGIPLLQFVCYFYVLIFLMCIMLLDNTPGYNFYNTHNMLY